MTKNYRHLGFETDEEFIAYHRRKAAEGDENSERILDTRNRIEQHGLYRRSAGRGTAKSPAAADMAAYCADAFEPEALIRK